jgi:hypothetical protein
MSRATRGARNDHISFHHFRYRRPAGGPRDIASILAALVAQSPSAPASNRIATAFSSPSPAAVIGAELPSELRVSRDAPCATSMRECGNRAAVARSDSDISGLLAAVSSDFE